MAYPAPYITPVIANPLFLYMSGFRNARLAVCAAERMKHEAFEFVSFFFYLPSRA